MKALSIKGLWAHAILNGGKRVENRSWPTNFRGQFALHVSKGLTRQEYDDDIRNISVCSRGQCPAIGRADLVLGAIAGVATITGCVTQSKSPWFFGPYGFELADVRAIATPIPCAGALSFWTLPPAVEANLLSQLGQPANPVVTPRSEAMLF